MPNHQVKPVKPATPPDIGNQDIFAEPLVQPPVLWQNLFFCHVAAGLPRRTHTHGLGFGFHHPHRFGFRMIGPIERSGAYGRVNAKKCFFLKKRSFGDVALTAITPFNEFFVGTKAI